MIMSVASTISGACVAALLAAAALGQDPLQKAYPERDMLTPFREPKDVYAPPDELFRQLRIMQNIAARRGAATFDRFGREVVDDDSWRRAFEKVKELNLDAGQLAQMMRLHRDAGQRATAFYAAFYCDNIDYVIELIEHIPGEPMRKTRERAYPRAIEFLRVHLSKRFGDLDDDAKQAMIDALPEPGSPAANAQGLVRKPIDSDYLHSMRLRPFCQLLDEGDAADQAQGLWFLKEVLRIRNDLGVLWLEPSMPRVRQLLLSDDDRIRTEAIGLLQAIGPKDLRAPPEDGDDALLQWATEAQHYLFPPIRNLNDTILELHPSDERDAIAAEGVRALENSSIGDTFRGQREDGSWYRGFKISYLTDELKPLAIPAEAVITTINGASVATGAEIVALVKKLVVGKRRPTKLFVEYVYKGKQRAVEFRVM